MLVYQRVELVLEMFGMFLTRVLTPDTYRAAFFSWALFIVDIFNAFLSPRMSSSLPIRFKCRTNKAVSTGLY